MNEARFASKEMIFIFSAQFKYTTWRRFWTEIAQIPMKGQIYTINWDRVAALEAEYKDDYKAQLHIFQEEFPSKAKFNPFSHFVKENTDLIQMREAMLILKVKLIQLIRQFTGHPQKKVALWIQDLLADLEDLNARHDNFHFLQGPSSQELAEKFNLPRFFPLSDPSYPRKQDLRTLFVLTSIATTAHRIAIEMNHDQIAALSLYLISLVENPIIIAATPSFDDTANRNLTLPEAFLTADSILNLLENLEIPHEPENKEARNYISHYVQPILNLYELS